MERSRNKFGKSAFKLSALTASCLMAFSSYAAVDCGSLQEWDSGAVYNGGAKVQQNGSAYSAKYWTQGNSPKDAGEWGVGHLPILVLVMWWSILPLRLSSRRQ